MKNFGKKPFPVIDPGIKKLLLTMKLTFLLTLMCILQVNATIYSQSINLKVSDVALRDALKEIESNSDYRFFYSDDLLLMDEKVSLVANNSQVEDVLNKLFSESQLTYKIFDNKLVIIAPKEQGNIKVSGMVTDATTGESVPGVNIIVEGTTIGVTTDMEGKYSLTVDNADVTLVFSFIGYTTERVQLQGRTVVNVKLVPDVKALDEVVVVGYGVQKKKLVTGATTQVRGDDIAKMSTTNFLDALKGQTPGVNITTASAQPGEGFRVSIRGLGTVGNASPLYIVDGVQTSNISYLNISDIESVDILKDAASAAIYGSRAANGVVLITTKQGKAGKAQISYDGYMGYQNFYKKMPYMNAKEYAVIMNEQYLNSGQSAPFATDQASMDALGKGTDWVDLMMNKNAITQNHSLGFTGGTDQSIYSVGLSYSGQDGIIGTSDKSNFERYTVRINTEHKIWKDYIRIGQHLTYSNTNKRGINTNGFYDNILASAYRATPLLEPYDEDGNVNPTGLTENSPILYMKYNYFNTKKEDKILGDAYIEIRPVRGVVYKSAFGMDFASGTNRSYNPSYELGFGNGNPTSKVTQDTWNGKTLTWENSVNYDLPLGRNHLNFLAGMSAQWNNGEKMWAQKYGLLIDSYDYAWLSNAKNTPGIDTDVTGSPYEKESLVSYFGRVNYDFDEKYLFTAILRADGSSKFAKDNRWGYFPSVSAGWVISNETFMQSSKSWLDYFKVRASWGQNGNQNIGNYRYMATLTTDKGGYSFGSTEGVYATGIFPDKLPNPDVAWETSEQTNIGLDARLLNNHLIASFDYYNKTTKDWLVEAPVLDIMGSGAPFINAGKVENNGFEIALGYNNTLGQVKYSINANLAYNKNDVKYIGNASGFLEAGGNLLYTNANNFFRAEAGYPIGYFYGLKTAGIFQNDQEVTDWLVQPGAQPGDIKFVDISGPNGRPDSVIDQNDRTMIGDPNPDYIFGLSFNIEYKGFDLSVITNGALGHQIAVGFLHNFNEPRSNYHQVYLNRWHGEGTSNEWPRVTDNTEANKNWTYINDLLIQNADYWKISNVTIGYDIKKALKKLPFYQLRVFFTAQNLYTFTSYLGMDPEVGFGVEDDAKRNYSSGIDVGYYPHPRTYMFGLSIKF